MLGNRLLVCDKMSGIHFSRKMHFILTNNRKLRYSFPRDNCRNSGFLPDKMSDWCENIQNHFRSICLIHNSFEQQILKNRKSSRKYLKGFCLWKINIWCFQCLVQLQYVKTNLQKIIQSINEMVVTEGFNKGGKEQFEGMMVFNWKISLINKHYMISRKFEKSDNLNNLNLFSTKPFLRCWSYNILFCFSF